MEAHQEAVRLDGDRLGESIFSLGQLYRDLGRYEEAAATIRRAGELARKEDRPDQVRRAEEPLHALDVKLALAARLPGLLAGTDRPKDGAELFEIGWVFHERRLNAAGARSYRTALGDAPGLAAGPNYLESYFANRQNAACLAAMAGCGRGKDEPPTDPTEREQLRPLALDWLRDLVRFGRECLQHGSPDQRAWCIHRMGELRKDGDLACVRLPLSLEKLPEPDRERLKAFWADVDGLEPVGGAGKP